MALVISNFGFQTDGPDGTYTFYVSVDVLNNYSVTDIRTPQGVLRDNRPLPEAVVRAMTEAMDLVQSGNHPVCDPSGITGTTGFVVI